MESISRTRSGSGSRVQQFDWRKSAAQNCQRTRSSDLVLLEEDWTLQDLGTFHETMPAI
jgi:hypothetical protein